MIYCLESDPMFTGHSMLCPYGYFSNRTKIGFTKSSVSGMMAAL